MYKVYWTNRRGQALSYDFVEMSEALNWAEFLRQRGRTYVTMVSENPNAVGRMGVDSVKDGVLPDGNMYEWKKRR